MLQQSAKGAAAQCSGGANGTTCGSDWSSSAWDGTQGLGQDLSALNIIVANLPYAGRLATSNGTASEAGTGGSGDDNNAGGSNSTGGGAAEGASDAASTANHVAVSSLALAVAIGSMMVFF